MNASDDSGDGDSGSDFILSKSESEEEPSEASDRDYAPTRRSGRARRRKSDDDFVVDGSDDSEYGGYKTKKKRRKYASDSDDSDNYRKKRRGGGGGRGRGRGRNYGGRKKVRRRDSDDSDSEDERPKKKRKPAVCDIDTSNIVETAGRGRRARAAVIDYSLLEVEGSDLSDDSKKAEREKVFYYLKPWYRYKSIIADKKCETM